MWGVRGLIAVAGVAGGAALGACGGQGAPVGRGVAVDTAKWSGMYVSDTLPGAARPQVVRLAVGRDTVAAVSIEFVGLGTTYHPGRWSAQGDRLTMQPTRGDGSPSELPFTWRLEGTRLIPLVWDKRIYGARGVTLTKQVVPAGPAADSSAGARR